MQLDFKKMLEQEPAFKEYCEKAALAMVLANKEAAPQLMATLFSFYSTGVDLKGITTWFENMNRFSQGNNNG